MQGVPGLFDGAIKKDSTNTGHYGIDFTELGNFPPNAYEFYNGLEVVDGERLTIHKSNLVTEFQKTANDGNGIDFGSLDSLARPSSFMNLEDNRKRIMDAFAILDVNHLINDNNRAMMLRYMQDQASEGYLARANYEIAVSNVYDMRETYMKTQQKVNDMTRLGEVQTYYKLYYAAKKKIILETIVVIVALIVLYALRENGILADGLFNLFFVIILFAYIFFRLSWQIVDFMSRDRRYFDKYDWGELDGSYNFHEFKDVSPEVVVKNKRRVTNCLEQFFKNLEGQNMDYATFENLMCSYIYLAEKDTKVETHSNGVPMYVKALWIVIYETLHLKYYGRSDPKKREIKNVKSVIEDAKDLCKPDEDAIKAGVGTESKDADITAAQSSCKTNKDLSHKHVTDSLHVILTTDKKKPKEPLSKVQNTATGGYSNLIDYTTSGPPGSLVASNVNMDPKGIIRIWWWLNELKKAVTNVIQRKNNGDEKSLGHTLSGITNPAPTPDLLKNSATRGTHIGTAQTSSSPANVESPPSAATGGK